jgi:hypothetical protein
VLGGLPEAMQSSTLKMEGRLMEVAASEARALDARGESATQVVCSCFVIG